MRKSLKPKFLGFIAAAGVHLSREQKKARNIEKHVIDLGRSVFGINLSNADDVVLAIDALGREGRRVQNCGHIL